MIQLAKALTLSSALLATPAGATGPYALDLLVDIYGVLARCAPLDIYYEALRKNVLDELETEGYTELQLAEVKSYDASGGFDLAKCAALVQPLIATYLAIPDSPRPKSDRERVVGHVHP